MNIGKRKKNFLSSVRTANALASLFIISGFLMIILSAGVGTLLFQSDFSGANVEVILNSLAPGSEPVSTVPGGDSKNATPLNVTNFAQDVKLSISTFLSSVGWGDLWALLGAAFLALLSGYLLRVLSVLAETQLIDYQSAG